LPPSRSPWSRFPPGAGAGSSATITDGPALAEVIEWLRQIDWTQRGADPAVITLPPPDGSIEVAARDGTTARFGFYWDGGFSAGRFIRARNVEELRRIVQRACE